MLGVDSRAWEGKLNPFPKKYCCQKYLYIKNIFAKNISPSLIVHHLYTPPNPSYPLFEVEGGDKQTEDELTDRTEQCLFLLLY